MLAFALSPEFLAFTAGRIDEGYGLRIHYNTNGFQTKTYFFSAVEQNLMEVTARYADGALAKGIHQSNPIEREYDQLGRLTKSRMTNSGGIELQQSTYTHDGLGNVISRAQTGSQTWNETFTYDTLSRLETITGTNQSAKAFSYSTDGNLKTKTGGGPGSIGTLTYGSTTRPFGAGPHAVASANIGPGGSARTFTYDNNGNFTGYTDQSRTISYTPFNLPVTITGTLNPTGI